ncbi:MAG: carbon-nitrogen hydrolase family protein [Thermotogota bacterium]
MKKTIVSVQIRSIPGQVEDNLKKTANILSNCSIPFDFILFPELFGTGYTWNETSKQLMIDKQKMIETWLKEISLQYNCVVISGIGRYDKAAFYNSTVVFDQGLFVDYYDKTHLFRGEKEIFQNGSDLKVYNLSDITVGVLMCYEIGIPEIARTVALKGADIIFVPFAYGRSRWVTYDTLTKARAIENACYICTSSTPGAHETFDFLGHSRIIAPSGEILCDALEREGWIVAEYDSDVVERFRYSEDDKSSGYWKNYRRELFVK